MATKTISLELDAYEKLRRAKRGGESFSAVVRRARFEETGESSAIPVEEASAGYGVGAGSPEIVPDYWNRIDEKDRIAVALESFDKATGRQDLRDKAWRKGAGKGKDSSGRGWTREELYANRIP